MDEETAVADAAASVAGGDGSAGAGAERVLESVVFEGEVLEALAVPGERAVEVTIIQPGLSSNHMDYPEDVLRASLSLWEGVAAFCDHPSWIDQSRAGGRSVRDLCGVYSDVRWDNGIRAKLRFNGQSGWLYDLVAEAIKDRQAGKAVPPIGISADMLVFRERMMDRWKIHQIRAVTSADVVFRPSAGGRFERILEGRQSVEEEQVQGGVGVGNPHPNPLPGGEGTGAGGGGVATVDRVSEAVSAELAAVREARVALCGALLDQRLSSSDLPAAAQERVRAQFAGRVFEARELDNEISSLKNLLGSVFQPQVVNGMGVSRVQLGLTSREKIERAMERLFGLPVEDTSIPRLSGIREAYILITGDKGFTGRYNWEESVLREANEVTTAVMNEVVGNVLNKRLVNDYRAQPKWWLPFVTRTSLKDMKLQTRILLNDFAALATVAENGPYTNLAWGDTAETYTPTKRGNLVYVTLEMIMNDDIRAVSHIPRKVASAAVVTINEFVSALFTANGGAGPAMADTFNVFDAANHQGNSGVAALSSAALQAAITVMMKFTNSAAKRLGIVPRFLLIPPDLLWTARTIVESQGLPGTPNNDINVTRGVAEPVVVPNWTDANNWYLLADPATIESIELGFIDGNEEPEFLIQDNPTSGSVFTNDAISFKVRHIYGGGWLDYRSAYGSIVP